MRAYKIDVISRTPHCLYVNIDTYKKKHTCAKRLCVFVHFILQYILASIAFKCGGGALINRLLSPWH